MNTTEPEPSGIPTDSEWRGGYRQGSHPAFEKLSLSYPNKGAEFQERFDNNKYGLWVEILNLSDRDFPPAGKRCPSDYVEGHTYLSQWVKADFVEFNCVNDFIRDRKHKLASSSIYLREQGYSQA